LLTLPAHKETTELNGEKQKKRILFPFLYTIFFFRRKSTEKETHKEKRTKVQPTTRAAATKITSETR